MTLRRDMLDRACRVFMTAVLMVPWPLAPATIVVGGACDLPDAVTAANTDSAVGGCSSGSGADTVSLTGDVSLNTIDNGMNGLPQVSSRIRVDGNGFTIGRDAGAPEFRFFEVLVGGELELARVTLTAGSISGIGDDGGAVLNDGTLTLEDSSVAANSATGFGGAIFNSGTMSIVSSTISDNSSDSGYGGGLYLGFGSTTTITESSITGNYAGWDGGGIFAYSGLEMTGSTLSGNSTNGRGGGFTTRYSYDRALISDTLFADNLASFGGGVYAGFGSDVVLTNVTLSGNSGFGGGVNQTIGGATTLVHSTVAGNAPYAIYVGDGSTVTLESSVVAASDAVNCFGIGTLVEEGANFDDDGSCGASSLLTGLDPVLADNGGPTLTHALLPGSTAVDAAGACGLLTDQRGFGRGAACDAGAFELDALPPVGGGVAGLGSPVARCTNLASGETVVISGSDGWNCRSAGLAIAAGDRVAQEVRGRPSGPALIGTVEGIGGGRARCRNFTTGQMISFPLGADNGFDCRSRGLVVSAGDAIGWLATGNADR